MERFFPRFIFSMFFSQCSSLEAVGRARVPCEHCALLYLLSDSALVCALHSCLDCLMSSCASGQKIVVSVCAKCGDLAQCEARVKKDYEVNSVVVKKCAARLE